MALTQSVTATCLHAQLRLHAATTAWMPHLISCFHHTHHQHTTHWPVSHWHHQAVVWSRLRGVAVVGVQRSREAHLRWAFLLVYINHASTKVLKIGNYTFCHSVCLSHAGRTKERTFKPASKCHSTRSIGVFCLQEL